MDRDVDKAVRWWVDYMQEPYSHSTECPRMVATAGNEKGDRWISPYYDRVVTNLAKFLSMPEKRQRIVVAAKHDGFWWRGEIEDVWTKEGPVWLFSLVLKEYERRDEIGATEYRVEAVKRMKSMRSQQLPYNPKAKLGGE